jgi:phage terminase large subunit
LSIELPGKLRGLFKPHRYKVAYGGRGGGKSWAFARALLILGSKQPLRILCTREVQKSIRDSVHKLLSDQVQALGLGEFYEVQQTTLKGKNGTEFLFSGLSDQTAESIKSYESIDLCWVEEAQAVTKRSWDILIPTIRKGGSEIWITFNPELDTDETYVRFVANPPPDALVVRMNYSDNPWHGDVLEKEREHAKATMLTADYENIWEGKCKPAVTGAIYAGEVAEAITANRIGGNVPYEPALKVHVIFDLGWNDKMALILAQKQASELRVIGYIEDSQKTLDWYSAELKAKRWNWGTLYLPHDGEHKDYKTGKSAQEILQSLGWTVDIVPNAQVEQGIRVARMAFPRVWFDKGCDRLVQCLRRYRRGVPTTTGEPGNPVHDEWSHGADAFRYLCLVADRMSNESYGGKLTYPSLGIA